MIQLEDSVQHVDRLSPDEERVAKMLKALSNPTRLGIVRFLSCHVGCITNDIVQTTPLAQATVSQHLKVLREAGLVQGTVEGPATSYCLNPEAFAWLRSRLDAILNQYCTAETCSSSPRDDCC